MKDSARREVMVRGAPVLLGPLAGPARRVARLGIPGIIDGVPTTAQARSGSPSPRFPDAPDRIPPTGSQTFRVYYGDYSRGLEVAEVTFDWRVQNGTYQAGATARAIGLAAVIYSGQLTQTSRGRVQGNEIVPERYTEKRGDRPERVVVFDHGRQIMMGSGQPPTVPLQSGVQDRLSIYFQIETMLALEPARYVPGYSFTVALASTSNIETAVLHVVNDELAPSAGGRVMARHLTVKDANGKGDGQIDVWLASQFDWRPVRLRVRDDKGNVIDQIHRSFRTSGSS